MTWSSRRIAKASALLLLACGLLPTLGAQQQPAQPMGARSTTEWHGSDAAKTPPPQLQTREPRYAVHPGDVLDLVFSFAPEFNQTVAVQPDGFVLLREVGELYFQDKTIAELTKAVAAAYETILEQPVVTVVLKDFEKPHFVVGGQVGRPGKYELRAGTTVMEAVAIAGGLTPASKHSQVLLFRRISNDWVEVKKLDLKNLQKGNIAEDFQLRPGDMLFVPQNAFSKIKPILPTTGVGAYMNPLNY